MGTMDDAVRLMDREWKSKTLADLWKSARKDKNGTQWQSLRVDNTRMMLAVCITAEDQLANVSRALGLPRLDRTPDDWTAISLLEAAYAAMTCDGGIRCEEILDDDGERTALFICAAQPGAVAFLESLLGLPKAGDDGEPDFRE